jgi:hypothetical protein
MLATDEPAALPASFWRSIPWHIWCAVLAISSSTLGVQWDIAWHRSIGRDTFWSPPHLAIYLGGVLSGLFAGGVILSTTFDRTSPARATAVRIFSLYGPLGAFLAAWGGVAMLASAPFDDWWHNAYGLDVKILSPPHTMLALGIFGISGGALVTVLGLMNGSAGVARRLLTALYLYTAGLLVVLAMTFEMEYTHHTAMHTATFYRVVATAAPALLIGLGRASRLRFGATLVAGVYSAVMLALLWLLPLVPATPKLGPVYYPVTHLIPAGFPLLLVPPAAAMDWLSPRLRLRSRWLEAVILAVVFLGVFALLTWPFASFLVSPHAENWFFGSGYHDYNTRPDWASLHHTFYYLERTRRELGIQAALALLVAVVGARLGLRLSAALASLRR